MKQRKRNRMQGFDYSSDAIYFITICCKNMICHLGEVINREMVLNAYGKIAQHQIEWLQNQYPYCQLHNFVVMPNHIHVLFEINRDYAVRTRLVRTRPVRTAAKNKICIRIDGGIPNHIIQTNPFIGKYGFQMAKIFS